jgi:hypothetical protein
MRINSKSQIKYEVGYQLSNEDFSFTNMLSEFLGNIDAVYFSWMDMPSGRSSLSNRRGYVEWDAQFRLERDLLWLKKQGVRLNLLFNGNCYGANSVSTRFRNNICSIIDHLGEIGAVPDIVTTCSPEIGKMVKKAFPGILIRASVNMRIGTIKGMQYLGHIFDEYNMQREYNRDLEHIAELKEWAENNGKGLVMLANSGCLGFCSAQTFHDNLVSHESDIMEMDNIRDWAVPNCRVYLENSENWPVILQSTWVRPEDIKNYAKYFPVIKLATRMHQNPWLVIRSYIMEEFSGSIVDLMEPGFSKELSPYMLDNKSFPDDWFKQTTGCKKNCHKCDYCKNVLGQILVNSDEYLF